VAELIKAYPDIKGYTSIYRSEPAPGVWLEVPGMKQVLFAVDAAAYKGDDDKGESDLDVLQAADFDMAARVQYVYLW